jgi:hypothetical protein
MNSGQASASVPRLDGWGIVWAARRQRRVTFIRYRQGLKRDSTAATSPCHIPIHMEVSTAALSLREGPSGR